MRAYATTALPLVGLAVVLAVIVWLVVDAPLVHRGRMPKTPATVPEDAIRHEDILSGRVWIPAGIPAQVVQVVVQADSTGQHPSFRRALNVSSTGDWQLEGLLERTYCVQVSFWWRGRRYHAAVEAETGHELLEIELAVDPPRPRKLAVRVVDHAGNPVHAGSIAVRPRPRPDGPPFVRFHEGHVTLEVFEGEGPLWFEAWSDSEEAAGSTVLGPILDVGEALELRFGPPRAIAGRVLGPSGEAEPGFQLAAWLLNDDGRVHHVHATASTDQEGRFTIRGLGDHLYEVHLQRAHDYMGMKPRVLRGGSTDVVIDLRRHGQVEVTVLDADGRPVAGAMVSATLPACVARGTIEFPDPIIGITNAEGVAALRELDLDLRYHLVVSPLRGRRGQESRALPDWSPRTMTIRLER